MRNIFKAKSMKPDKGFILPNILFIMMFLTVILFGLVDLSNSVLYRARSRVYQLQALYAAESGADAALAMLNSASGSYSGTASPVTILTAAQDKATFTNTVSAGSDSNQMIIMATGNVYVPKTASTPTYTRTVRVVAKRSSTTTSSAIVSRNILDIASSVKTVTAVDLYINGYINMAKNTNKLYAENITVGGKNTGASNCSIGGTGNLLKPASFTHAGQTKTNLKLQYNNCITPPGNTSNTDFNVSANTSVDQIVSTFVPFGQFMDNSSLNAGSCSDWTGTSPLSIPSVPNHTHYPDSSSNVSSSCGTSGNIDLGSKTINISDNVHVRANFCQASSCSPTFNNTTSTLKWIFVEGDVDFASVQTSAGSGPIVLVSYGSDPSSLSVACPDGGAIHVGTNGSQTTNAPALFLLASNGLCLERTKFSAGQSLAGVSGKNVYIATNSGTPFDLAFNPTFPVDQIPTNLSWRAVLYQQTTPPN
ncbi:MAG TPA: hypothetical protein VLG47_01530 [Candidatus Saccharimonadales bacterium]|nr:hypothetical protein [Candidatus Saccharimonadales bacterium]